MTIDQTKDVPGVEEQRRMTEEMNQRIRERGECAWGEPKGLPNCWSTACGNEHYFDYQGPKENKHRFCPYCGGKLVVK